MIIIFSVLSKPPSNLHEKTHRDVTCLMLRRKQVFIAHGEAKYCDKARRQTLFTDETEKNTLLRIWLLRLCFRIGEMLSRGISLNLESIRMFWLALEIWNGGAGQNLGKAYYEGGAVVQRTDCCSSSSSSSTSFKLVASAIGLRA